MEVWKPIINFEGIYEVSNYGNVRSLDREIRYSNGRVHYHKGRVLSNKSNGAYLQVDLRNQKNGKANRLVHILVATAFIDNPENKPQVDHKDGNKTNNHVDNLRWFTVSENRNAFGYDKVTHKVKAHNVVTEECLNFNSQKEALEHFKSKGHELKYNYLHKWGKFGNWIFEKIT